MAERFRNLNAFAHELTKEEKMMTGKKHPKLDPVSTREQFRWSILGKNILVAEPCSYSFYTCNKPLSSLKRTCISEQRVNIPSLGKYLMLRTLEGPVTGAKAPIFGTTTVILAEDHNKDITICCLFGYVISHFNKPIGEILPVNTVFVLKEPRLKPCKNESFAIVVGSSSDFVIIDRSHVLSRDLELLGWRVKLCVDQGTLHLSETIVEWKNVANEFFKQKRYDEAVELYRLALNNAEETQMKLILNLNLAATYLQLGYFESSVKHAREVLEIQPKNEKALYRAGRGHYELRQYDEAMKYFEDVLTGNPSNENALSEKERCEARLKEQQGLVDVCGLHKQALISPSLPLECGNFVGQVKFVSNTNLSRGAFATVDTKPGTLLLTEKSLAFTVKDSDDPDVVLEKYLANATSVVWKNPKTFGSRILNLRTGKPALDNKQEKFCDVENQREIIINHFGMFKILTTYVLNNDHNTLNPAFRQLFVLASAFNHSCVPNCTFAIYNDVITIQTCKFVKEGEEYTISYFSTFPFDYQKRLELLEKLHLSCNCVVCKLDGKENSYIHQKRKSIDDRLVPIQILERIPIETVVQTYRGLVKQMEETYGKRSTLRVSLYGPYFYLAKAIMVKGDYFWEVSFRKCIEKALESIGLPVDVLLMCAEDEKISLPQDAIITEELFDIVLLMVEKEQVCNCMEEVSKWAKALLFLERLFTLGNFQMLKNRLKIKSYLFPLLSMFIE